MSDTPRVTIGLPVRNGAAQLKRALDSLLQQTHRDFTLRISDNASDDQTPDICKTYAAADSRVTYVRRDRSVGGFENFRGLVKSATTPFFTWAAHSNWYDPEFLSANVAALEGCPTAVLSASRIDYMDGTTFVRHSVGTSPLTGSVTENLAKYFDAPGDNNRVYGLFRTDVLRKSAPDVPECWAEDWLWGGLSLLYGSHIEVPRVLLHRQAWDRWKYIRAVKRQGARRVTQSFPALPVSLHVLRLLPLEYRRSVLLPLLKRNIAEHIDYVSYHSPTGRQIWIGVRAVGLTRVWALLYRLACPAAGAASSTASPRQ